MATEMTDERLEALLTQYVKTLLADELCSTLPSHLHEAVKEAVIRRGANDGH
jgi:hypothetical protein